MSLSDENLFVNEYFGCMDTILVVYFSILFVDTFPWGYHIRESFFDPS
jgi:hypothetical protein